MKEVAQMFRFGFVCVRGFDMKTGLVWSENFSLDVYDSKVPFMEMGPTHTPLSDILPDLIC